MTDYERRFILNKCSEGVRDIRVNGYPVIVHLTLTLEKSEEFVSAYCFAYFSQCTKPYAIFNAQRLWKQGVICAYTDIAKGEEVAPEMMNEFVYGTPIYDMLVGENGYEPVINMEQYRDLREAAENTLRLWLCCAQKDAQAAGENVEE